MYITHSVFSFQILRTECPPLNLQPHQVQQPAQLQPASSAVHDAAIILTPDVTQPQRCYSCVYSNM